MATSPQTEQVSLMRSSSLAEEETSSRRHPCRLWAVVPLEDVGIEVAGHLDPSAVAQRQVGERARCLHDPVHVDAEGAGQLVLLHMDLDRHAEWDRSERARPTFAAVLILT